MKTECILAISGTEVIGVGDVAEASTWFTTEPGVTEVVRMPVAAARLLYTQWPGRDAAIAALTGAAMPDIAKPERSMISICDCERGHNGMGLVGRECDCFEEALAPAFTSSKTP